MSHDPRDPRFPAAGDEGGVDALDRTTPEHDVRAAVEQAQAWVAAQQQHQQEQQQPPGGEGFAEARTAPDGYDVNALQQQAGPATVEMQSPFHPAPGAAATQVAAAGKGLQNFATRGFVDYLRNLVPHLRRVFRGNLATNLASPDERAWLADRSHVHGDCGQSFLVWRRSAMVLMIVPLAVTALVAVIAAILDIVTLSEQTDQIRAGLRAAYAEQLAPESLHELGRTVEQVLRPLVTGFTAIKIVSILVTLLSFGLAVLALRHWHDYLRSRRYLMASWAIGFALPFAMSLVPMRLLLRKVPLPTLYLVNGIEIPPAQLREVFSQLEVQIGLAFGLYMFVLLAPTVLTLFPAMIRSSLYTKTLVPQSPVPGWITVIVPVFYVLVTFAFFALLNQLAGDGLLLGALFLLILSPMAYLLQARKLTAPMSASEVFPAVRRARFLSLVVAFLAAGMLFAYVRESDILKKLELVNAWSLAQMTLEFVGKYLITTLIGCDVLVRILVNLRKRAQEDEIGGAILASELTHRLDELVELDQRPGGVRV